MIKGSTLTLTEIEAGGKEYLRTDGYDKNGCYRLYLPIEREYDMTIEEIQLLNAKDD